MGANANDGIPRFGRRTVVALAVICGASIAGHLAVYPWLPARIPSHWGVSGAVNATSPKQVELLLDLLPVALVALFWVVPRVSRNYSFGVKTPWALADPLVWQKSQRMGGRTFVAMGVGLVALGVLSPLMPDAAVFAVLLALVIGGSIWTVLYSYLVWRRRYR
jgi:uncharacterized membrane protein